MSTNKDMTLAKTDQEDQSPSSNQSTTSPHLSTNGSTAPHPSPPTPPLMVHWSNLLTRFILFTQRYTHDARDESTRLHLLRTYQQLYHRLTRDSRVLHGWRQFLALDELAWIERNELWNEGKELTKLSTYGPLAGWADFLRFLRQHTKVVALTCLTPSTKATEKVQAMLGYNMADEKAAIGEILTFSLYGHIAAEREFESFRLLLRRMLLVEVSSLNGALPTIDDFWRILQTHPLAPIDKETHTRAASGSIALPTPTTPNSPPPNTPSPPAAGTASMTSAASASLQFRSRPLRMILLELMLRRACGGGAFLASILADPLRSILQDSKRNLDPQEQVVATMLALASMPNSNPAMTMNGAGATSPPPDSNTNTGFFSRFQRASSLTPNSPPAASSSSALSTSATTKSPTELSVVLNTLPPNSTKVRQAVRVTEQLLCSSVDKLLDALLHAGPRWPLPVKLLIGDMLRCTQSLWQHTTDEKERERAASAKSTKSTSTDPSSGVSSPSSSSPPSANFVPASTSPDASSSPTNGSPPSSIPYTVAENCMLSDETSTLFAGSIAPTPQIASSLIASTAAATFGVSAMHRTPSSFLSSSSSSSTSSIRPLNHPHSQSLSIAASLPTASGLGPPLPARLRQPSIHRSASTPIATVTVPGVARPMKVQDRSMVLAHILFGLLILPALQKPNLSGLYLDSPLRTRARLNLKVICVVLEQVLIGQPFPPTNHLCCVNKYIVSKAAIVQQHLKNLADHCLKLSLERQVQSLESEDDDEEDYSLLATTMTNIDADTHPTDATITSDSTPPAAPDRTVTAVKRSSIFPVFGSESAPPAIDTSAISPQTTPASPTLISMSPIDLESNHPVASSAPISPPLILHQPTVCLTLQELVTLHHAIFRHTERLANGSPSDRRLLEELMRFKNLPLNGQEPEWTEKQVLELDLVDVHQDRTNTNPHDSYPRLISLSTRMDEWIQHERKSSLLVNGYDCTSLLVLLAHTFHHLPPESTRSYAGKPADLMSLLSHARHALESNLTDEWETSSQAIAYISELESELKRVSTTYFAPPVTSPTKQTRHLSIVGQRRTSVTTAPPPFQLSPELNQLLFTQLFICFNSFESNHTVVQQSLHASLLYSTQLFRRSLLTLRGEHRFLRDLNFINKILIFVKQKRNVSQNIHLGKMKFALPNSFSMQLVTTNGTTSTSSPIPQTTPQLTTSASAYAPNHSNVPLFFTANSIEAFITNFEVHATSFSKDLPTAAKLLHHFFQLIERAVREDVGLNTSEMGGSSSQTNGTQNGNSSNGREKSSDDADPTPIQPGSIEEFIDPPLHGDSLATKACDLLEHILCTRLYPVIFPSDRSSISFADELFLWKLKELSNWLLPRHVHLFAIDKDDICWQRPLQLLHQLDQTHSPTSKLALLSKSLKWLSKLLGVKPAFKHMDADSTLSGLIFLLVKAQPTRFQSNLLFIETFLPAHKLIGELSYVLTQWSLATHYISETLSLYDQAALESEMEHQRVDEEARLTGRRPSGLTGSLTSATAPLSSPTNALLSLAAAVAPGGARTPSASMSRTRASSAVTSTPSTATNNNEAARVGRTSLSGAVPISSEMVELIDMGAMKTAGAIHVLPPTTPSTGASSLRTPLMPSGTASAASLLSLSLKASRERTRSIAYDASHLTPSSPPTSPARVFRTPSLFHLILTYLAVHETALISSVSTAFCMHGTHATRKASVVQTTPQLVISPVDAPTNQPSTTTVPSPRLVGIESNPGPAESNTHKRSPTVAAVDLVESAHPSKRPCQNAVTSTLTSDPSTTTLALLNTHLSANHPPSAETLFVDGLLSIYQYLTLADLLPALHTCHYWYACGLKERCRRMDFCLENGWSADQETQFCKLLNLIDSPLKYHITSLRSVSMCHLIAIKQLLNFTNLHTCHFEIDRPLSKLVTKFRKWNQTTSINPNEFSSSLIQLPPSLQIFHIRSPGFESICPATVDFCQSLINGLAHSAVHEFQFRATLNHQFDLSPIGQTSQLTTLRLFISMPLIEQVQQLLASLPLTELSIAAQSSPNWSLLHPSSPLMLSIRAWSWRNYSITTMKDQNFMLHLVAHPPPNLTRIDPTINWDMAIIDFTVFAQLTHLQLYGLDYPALDEHQRPELYTPILSRCHSLTHLFLHTDFFNDDQLCRILIGLKDSLVTLELDGDDDVKPIRSALVHLPPITKLDTLRLQPFELFLTTLAKSTRVQRLTISVLVRHADDINFPKDPTDLRMACQRVCHQMKRDFILVLKDVWDPNLKSLGWKDLVFVHTAPPSTVPIVSSETNPSTIAEYPFPPIDLTKQGVEPNPGPQSSESLSLSGQVGDQEKIEKGGSSLAENNKHIPGGLYRDVLQHIFTFLPFREFVRACRLQRYWYAAGCTMKPRKEQFEYEGIGRISALIQSPLRSHITQLTIVGEYPKLNRLLCDGMDHLETLILDIQVDQVSMPSSLPVPFPLPTRLRDLSIDFELWDGCDLTVESGACTFIAECLKQIAAQSAHLMKLDIRISKAFGDMECPHDVPNLPTLTWIRLPRQFRLNSTIDFIKSLSSLCCWCPSVHLHLEHVQRLVDRSDLCSPSSMLEDIGGLWNVDEAMSNHLRRLKNLTQLDFTWFELEDPTTLFPHFPRLTTIDLVCVTSVNVDHLARALAVCVRLTDLRLNHMYLTSDHMSLFLPPLISLTELKLYGCDSVVSLQFLTVCQTSLTNLRRFEISQSAQMPISEFAHHLPAISKSLEYLIINNSFEPFDPLTIARWTPGSSEFSRDDWPRLKVFNLHQPKPLNEILGFELPPEVPSSANVPAPPLIGIETNPGPSASISISTVLTQTPQTLFKNGLHLVYSFLDTRDWCSSLQTCAHWCHAGSSEPSRHLRVYIQVDHLVHSLPPLRLRHHITILQSSHQDGNLHVTEAQLLNILQTFPFLEQIRCTFFLTDKVEAVPWKQSHLPNLEFLALDSSELRLGELGDIFEMAPNLASLRPDRFCLNNLTEELCAFNNLLSVSFTAQPRSIGVNVDSDCESIVTAGLTRCTQLTELEFGQDWMLTERASWLELCDSLTSLRKLVLGSWTKPTNNLCLYVFTGFKQLDHFIINDSFIGKRMQFAELRGYFSPPILAKWRVSILEIGMSTNLLYYALYSRDEHQQLRMRRLGQDSYGSTSTPHSQLPLVGTAELNQPIDGSVIVPPSPLPLVGIELNPGPLDAWELPEPCLERSDSNSPPSTLWTTIPRDWLEAITTFLTLNELIHGFGSSCQYWFKVLQTIKSRQDTLYYSKLGSSSASREGLFNQFLISSYQRHISEVKLIFRGMASYEFMAQMSRQLPHLRVLTHLSIDCTQVGSIVIDPADSIQPIFPAGIQELHIELLEGRRLHAGQFDPQQKTYVLGMVRVLTQVSQLKRLKRLKLELSPGHPPFPNRQFQLFRDLPHLTKLELTGARSSIQQLEAMTVPKAVILPLTEFDLHFSDPMAIKLIVRLQALQILVLGLIGNELMDLALLSQLAHLKDLTMNCTPDVNLAALVTCVQSLHHTGHRYNLRLSHPVLTSIQLTQLMPYLTHVQRMKFVCMWECRSFDFLFMDTRDHGSDHDQSESNRPVYEWTHFTFQSNLFPLTRPYSQFFLPASFPLLEEVHITGEHELTFDPREVDETVNSSSNHFRPPKGSKLRTFKVDQNQQNSVELILIDSNHEKKATRDLEKANRELAKQAAELKKVLKDKEKDQTAIEKAIEKAIQQALEKERKDHQQALEQRLAAQKVEFDKQLAAQKEALAKEQSKATPASKKPASTKPSSTTPSSTTPSTSAKPPRTTKSNIKRKAGVSFVEESGDEEEKEHEVKDDDDSMSDVSTERPAKKQPAKKKAKKSHSTDESNEEEEEESRPVEEESGPVEEESRPVEDRVTTLEQMVKELVHDRRRSNSPRRRSNSPRQTSSSTAIIPSNRRRPSSLQDSTNRTSPLNMMSERLHETYSDYYPPRGEGRVHPRGLSYPMVHPVANEMIATHDAYAQEFMALANKSTAKRQGIQQGMNLQFYGGGGYGGGGYGGVWRQD